MISLIHDRRAGLDRGPGLGGDRYIVESVGDRTAEQVQVAIHESRGLRSPDAQHARLWSFAGQ